MQKTLAVVAVGALACQALGAGEIRITEWMYSGGLGAEFIELTNVGNMPVDMTGWSFDDDSQTPNTLSLSAFGVVAPGESVIIAEDSEADFRMVWSLALSVKVIGSNTTNLGRNDEINIYDSGSNLIDRLTYGDQNIPGTIRTQNRSGNPMTIGALGANDVAQWQLAFDGDGFGTYASASGDLGNPGYFVPTPGTIALVSIVGIGALRRRRN